MCNEGWTIKGKDSANADVNANIGKGKTVTYNNGNYSKAVVTKDDSGNATVTVDVTTGTLTTGTDGKITSADGPGNHRGCGVCCQRCFLDHSGWQSYG